MKMLVFEYIRGDYHVFSRFVGFGFGFGAWFFWVFGFEFGSGFESIFITKDPKKTSTKTKSKPKNPKIFGFKKNPKNIFIKIS